MNGLHIGDDLVIDWSDNYDILSKLYAEDVLLKEDYLNLAKEIIESIHPIITEISQYYNRYVNDEMDEYLYMQKMMEYEKESYYLR